MALPGLAGGPDDQGCGGPLTIDRICQSALNDCFNVVRPSPFMLTGARRGARYLIAATEEVRE
jgi:hypothetical protein